jgi:hypothetical protein
MTLQAPASYHPQTPPPQLEEQHSQGALQDWPFALHAPASRLQAPALQSPEQQSHGELHDWPSCWHEPAS